MTAAEYKIMSTDDPNRAADGKQPTGTRIGSVPPAVTVPTCSHCPKDIPCPSTFPCFQFLWDEWVLILPLTN